MGGRTVEGEHISLQSINYELDVAGRRTEVDEAVIAEEVQRGAAIEKLVKLIIESGGDLEDKHLTFKGSREFWDALESTEYNFPAAAKKLGLEVDEE